jgi:hypothetical protein
VQVTLSLFVLAQVALAADEFSTSVKPILEQNCKGCHNPANPKNRLNFLKANSADDMNQSRLLWRDVATQIRNRTMPPMASKLTEADRLRISTWIDARLRQTACSAGESSVAVTPRRLNRREYHNTIRDILGVDLIAADLFPADESGGNGFDTNGDTLYIPPMLLERYMEAAQKILDRVIITPPTTRVIPSSEMLPPMPSTKTGRSLKPGEALRAEAITLVEGRYNLKVNVERPRHNPFEMTVSVDGGPPTILSYGRDLNGGATTRIAPATLTRGVHQITVTAGNEPVEFYSFTIEQAPEVPSQEKRALHYRLFGMEPGESPADATVFTRRLLVRFMSKAYRRPVTIDEAQPFYRVFERAWLRGDPFEESIKMALKAVLVSPRFLFRVEDRQAGQAVHPVAAYDLASRLSYLFWSTVPDEELYQLAAANKLQDDTVLSAQVDRMLDDPRSRTFASTFIGQWLGTQEVGGRVVPLLTELQHYYTPEVAAELRQEPVLFFQDLINRGGSLLDLLNGNYTFLTARLARFYQVDSQLKAPLGDRFTRVEWPDNRRAGVLGMASVLAMTSHYKQASPILRGAWVLDTLLGTPVPPPPPNVPPLETAAKSEKGLTMKQILARHRSDAACSSCHNLMDPIGFGLEHFDWMGRWRATDSEGRPVDAKGTLPSGESFDGAVELRQVLLGRKRDFVRHVTGKVLGYALGRAVGDADQCTIERIVDKLEQNAYSARLLLKEVVLSAPFRNHYPTAAAAPIQSTTSKPVRTRLLGDK